MSEIIVLPGSGDPPGSGLYPDYGLRVISEQPVVLRRPPTTPAGTIAAIGSPVDDYIAAIDPNNTTIFTLAGGDGNDTLIGAAGPDVISGDGGNDVGQGGSGDDILDGGTGNDVLQGEDGNDFLQGGDGNDTLQGGNGTDLLVGGSRDDYLDGGPGNDVLIGGPGRDVLVGGEGDDRLQGGPGKDLLTGGLGKDSFRFEKGSTGSKKRKRVDVITDFNPQEDTIELDRRLLKGQVNLGELKDEHFKSVRKIRNDIDAKIIYERRSGLLYFNPEKGPTIILMQLDKNLKITAANFEVFY
ncbi:calcium-binding protein [Thermocoleostomius sinensis]|jgi:Ca2+-binding RTX toxin-like protein|uniref:Calcium-binding protein n=1 Tax=Thermocoleostomius sinensis A174 TaxID=2016057 RepID=A0A9E8ZHG9_9CYAN|nr:calcium-binding protein [Thermocoleostomius sinensis]WAL58601.1 calcium-binding protein [Thermocoleostomius sinensis A174]